MYRNSVFVIFVRILTEGIDDLALGQIHFIESDLNGFFKAISPGLVPVLSLCSPPMSV